MNKPLAFICACIVAVGLIILGAATYFTVVYGHGNTEAGNWHRVSYTTERDALTGNITRSWDIIGESTEGSPLYWVNTWDVGVAFIVMGATLYVTCRCLKFNNRP